MVFVGETLYHSVVHKIKYLQLFLMLGGVGKVDGVLPACPDNVHTLFRAFHCVVDVGDLGQVAVV